MIHEYDPKGVGMKELWARVARWFTDSRRQAVQAAIASLVALLTMLDVTTSAQSSALLDLSASALLLVQGVIGLSLLRRSDAFTWLNEYGRGAVYAVALGVGAVGVAFTAWGDDTAAQIATVTTAVLSILTAFVQVVNVGTLSSPWPLADPVEWEATLAAFAKRRATDVDYAELEENPATYKTERDPEESLPSEAPTPGRIVLYTLSEADVEAINRRRLDASLTDLARAQTGARVHVGNEVRVGDVVPAVVVRVWPTGINAQAYLDGADSLWLTSRPEGTEPGTWAWPARG